MSQHSATSHCVHARIHTNTHTHTFSHPPPTSLFDGRMINNLHRSQTFFLWSLSSCSFVVGGATNEIWPHRRQASTWLISMWSHGDLARLKLKLKSQSLSHPERCEICPRHSSRHPWGCGGQQQCHAQESLWWHHITSEAVRVIDHFFLPQNVFFAEKYLTPPSNTHAVSFSLPSFCTSLFSRTPLLCYFSLSHFFPLSLSSFTLFPVLKPHF